MSRLDLKRTNPLGMTAVLGLEGYCRRTMDTTLKELVVLRASLLNDCRYCVTLHRRDALRHGEEVGRLDAMADWTEHRELYSETEQVALELTDAVTLIHGEESVPDELWTRVVAHLGEQGAGHLLLTIATINVWNRVAITTRQDPASLRP